MNWLERYWRWVLALGGAVAFFVTVPAARSGVDVDVNINPPSAMVVHHYMYYPQAEVYFVPEQKVYWFYNGTTWISAPNPPPGIVLGTSVKLDIDKPEPWHEHEVIVKKYGGKHGKMKVKEKIEDKD